MTPEPPPPPAYSAWDSAPPAAPPDPVWRGLDVALIVVITGVALVLALMIGVALLAIGAAARASAFSEVRPLVDVRFLLAVQTAALAAGFAFAAVWITRLYRAPFWRAIHLRRVSAAWVGGSALLGLALSLLLGGLERYLPIPPQLPIDRLFNSRSAWALMIYGVGIAPFFEEFFFRGLIYPSLRLSFAAGMTPAQARAWRPFLWAGALAGVVLAGARWAMAARRGVPTEGAAIGLAAAIAVGALAGPIMAGIGWIFRQLARARRGELFAVILTGILFGLAHSAQLADNFWPVAVISVVGIVLTALRARSGSIVPGWIAHCVYNGAIFAALYAGTRGFHDFHHLAR